MNTYIIASTALIRFDGAPNFTASVSCQPMAKLVMVLLIRSEDAADLSTTFRNFVIHLN